MFATTVTRNKNLLRLLVTLTFLLVFPMPTSNTIVRAAPTYTNVGGPIISDTTWTLANSPYIVTSNVQVMTGITLTIEAGVVVKFNSSRLLLVDGTLIARGNASNFVTFTSNQASPQPGDWVNLFFSDSSIDASFDGAGYYVRGSILQYCIVEYAGGSTVHGAIETQNASPFIDHCSVHHNNSSGIWGIGMSAPIVISNNTISYNTSSYWHTGGGMHVSNGIVSSNLVVGNSTAAGGGIWAEYSWVNSNTVSGNLASDDNYQGAGGGGIDASHSTVSNNTITGNFVSANGYSIGGGISVSDSTLSNNAISGNWVYSPWAHGGGVSAYASTVSNNVISSNGTIIVPGNAVNPNAFGGGIDATDSTVSSNIISGNWSQYGGGIHVKWAGRDTTIMTNTITGNAVQANGQGAGVYLDAPCSGFSCRFIHNTVVGNIQDSPAIAGVAINGTPQFHYNNLYGNADYDVVVLSSGDVSGTNNYWGTTQYVNINQKIYDWYDDSSRGKFYYAPYLQDPDLDAPVPPPTNLHGDFTGNSVTFSWDPIPSTTTGYGYKVYYDNDASGPPYNGTGATQGNSPIDVGSATSYSLTGLGSGIYYVTITAYDALGHESWYSNQINKLQANFVAQPTEGFKPLTVVFTNISNAGYTQSLWNFGDAMTSTLYRPTHTYTSSGVYTVSLTVSGSGDTDTLTRTNFITVTNPPPASASVVKSVTPQGTVWYGNVLTYTLVISATPGAQVGLYDPLGGTTFLRFVTRPAGVVHSNGVITGTLTATPTQYATVTFVVRVSVPDTAGSTTDVTNRACVYVLPGTPAQCQWSNSVTNSSFRPYSVFLPIVLRR